MAEGMASKPVKKKAKKAKIEPENEEEVPVWEKKTIKAIYAVPLHECHHSHSTYHKNDIYVHSVVYCFKVKGASLPFKLWKSAISLI